MPDQRPTFLLVHGAWHQSSCWAPLQAALAENGWRSDTVDLPSSGDQSTPNAGMYDDAVAIEEALQRVEGPTVIVAHSYGGIPVTQAAVGHPEISHLVYLAAYMPAEGESMYDIHGLPIPEELSGTFPLIDNPRESLYGDLPDDAARVALDQLVEQSLRSFAQPVNRAAWRAVPSTYILCEQDQAILPTLQETMSSHASSVVRIQSGHSPFLFEPDRLATLLGKVVGG
ncbi:alpha/beta hydrolase [Streptomyces sp. HGB0020]|uniref:alpha/beta hydrolase n=1 Tax=Streptomyces sp. HGB0020 TaxID=1078086 RepID=UPI00055F0217|nr:alpha/beta hydrolase [Streptomyces sp. HGB0020]